MRDGTKKSRFDRQSAFDRRGGYGRHFSRDGRWIHAPEPTRTPAIAHAWAEALASLPGARPGGKRRQKLEVGEEMNISEMEDAVSALVEGEFNAEEFPYEFLKATGAKATTLKRLRAGETNFSDCDGVLCRNSAHIKVCAKGQSVQALQQLRQSPATEKYKARFLLATDGEFVELEDRTSGEIFSGPLESLVTEAFSLLMPLGGLESHAIPKENRLDYKASRQLNRLYLELCSANPEWQTPERSRQMNLFLARLIFCLFAEDTEIFNDQSLFTKSLAERTNPDGSDFHTALEDIFHAMSLKPEAREQAAVPRWATKFAYVNGGLFSGDRSAPTFTRTARSYLLRIGELPWKDINPDIFGSMIQAVADPEERESGGIHYTSVPNILKVLNPLFLDELRARLEECGDNRRKLQNLRKRLARIRVFDPACGSGNFLVIAYKELRAIEGAIDERLGDSHAKSDISLTNFRGIEIQSFAADIARIALVIAKYQCDVRYCGQLEAIQGLLPLSSENWIVQGNALRLDWKEVCPPSGTTARIVDTEYDLFATPLAQTAVDFENDGGETYICGNPPYLGSTNQDKAQKDDMKHVFSARVTNFSSLDYVAAWFMKAAEYGDANAAFVSTNSICQGQQVARLWPAIASCGFKIHFAYTSFKWKNNAAHNAGVTVVIVGISANPPTTRKLFSLTSEDELTARDCANINAYLVSGPDFYVDTASAPLADLPIMDYGNKPVDGGHLFLNYDELLSLTKSVITPPIVATMFLLADNLKQRSFAESTAPQSLLRA